MLAVLASANIADLADRATVQPDANVVLIDELKWN
jgi:hypothetical protein